MINYSKALFSYALEIENEPSTLAAFRFWLSLLLRCFPGISQVFTVTHFILLMSDCAALTENGKLIQPSCMLCDYV